MLKAFLVWGNKWLDAECDLNSFGGGNCALKWYEKISSDQVDIIGGFSGIVGWLRRTEPATQLGCNFGSGPMDRISRWTDRNDMHVELFDILQCGATRIESGL